MRFDKQSIVELEFNVVCDLLAQHCKSQRAKENALKLGSFNSPELLTAELNILSEIQLIYEDEAIAFPHPNSEDIDHALKLLRIENGVLTLDELLKVYTLCLGTKQLIDFTNKHKQQFPLIHQACEHIDRVKDIILIIKSVLTDRQEIKDDATKELKAIRGRIFFNEKEVNRNFERVLRKYKADEIIGDIEETYIQDKRLLSVLSQYKKRVKGKVHGASSRGTYTYIEPEENIGLNKQLEQLRIDERNEIFKILRELTDQLRGEKDYLEAFQRLLVRFDLFNAKVLFAETYQGIKPKINKEKSFYWQNARHPLLLIKNNEFGYETVGQTIELSPEKRFLVISGPNAGGKSITLKTVGLLQMMFQSGLFLPLDDVSSCCWFDKILSDIGDNQSIENQLSTYSYRLSRMDYFLQHANQNSLLLLDEFGSGSDPELGGALAEVFYEELYNKQLYAVVTTHYTNIKIITAELPQAINACMLFDTKQLKPLYQLSVGQPGSSFTFEVAKLNGISSELIDRAKQKVSTNKLKVDELTVSLQKEKSKLKKINDQQYKATYKANNAVNEYETKLNRLLEKADQQARFFEQQNKFVNTGKKIYEIINKNKKHKTNKVLFEDVKKYVAIEKSKVLKAEKSVVFDKKLKLPDLPKSKEAKIGGGVSKKTVVKPAPVKKERILKVGDKVKLNNYNQPGVIQEIKGNKLSVLLGNFVISTTKKEIQE